MPTVPSPAKVLVTGANGYIAAWIVHILLEQGYTVRGTVRSAGKVKYLADYFGQRGYGTDKLEFVVVGDITKEGAFDEAVKDIDAIEHTASPFVTNIVDPQGFIEPAVRGTISLLQSALKHGLSLKRVVITSSCAAIMAPPSEPTVFTENDWNNKSVQEVEEKGKDAMTMSKYRTSKTMAEKAAWEFYAKHKNQIKWDMTVINPPFVFGPPIQEVEGGPAGLNLSLKSWYDVIVDNQPKPEDQLYTSNAWVDVRDTALAHVLALQKEAAAGERIIVSTGSFVWQDWLDVANSLNPYPLQDHVPDKGIPGLKKAYLIQYNTEKERHIFGIEFRSMADTTRDTLIEFANRGWLRLAVIP